MAPRTIRRHGRRRTLDRRRLFLEALEARQLLASYTTPEDTPLTVPVPTGVQAVVDSGPEHGTVVQTNIGNLVYLPAENFYGSDRFTYRLGNDTTQRETAEIAITAVNDAPVANPDYYSAVPNRPLTIVQSGVLANDTDVDNRELTAVLAAEAQHGKSELRPNGLFTYTPDANYHGPDSFLYRASDGLLASEMAKVLINVGYGPLAYGDTYAVQRNTSLDVPAPGVLANDRPGTSDTPLKATLVSGPEHGTLELRSDGSFAYKPATDYAGVDAFSYRVSDGSGFGLPTTAANTFANGAMARVTIYVTADAPPFAVNDTYSTGQGHTIKIAAPGVLANDIGSGRPLAATVLEGPKNGTLALKEDGSFEYVPKPDFYGIDTFSYKVSNAASTPPVAAATVGSADNTLPPDRVFDNVGIVSIYVRPAQPPVIARNDFYATKQNQVLEVAAPGVLGNDHVLYLDPPLQLGPFLAVTNVMIYRPPLKATLVTGPAHGELSLQSDGSFRYKPAENYIGRDSFTYRASISTETDSASSGAIATAWISINPVNNSPVAHDDTYLALQETPLAIEAPGVLKNDEGITNTSSALLVTPPSSGQLTLERNGSFKYVPRAGFFGSDAFTYRVINPTPATTLSNTAADDGPFSNVATVWIHVRPNDPLVNAEDDKYVTFANTALSVEAPGVLKNDYVLPRPALYPYYENIHPIDISRPHRLTASVEEGPENGTLTLNPDGSFKYTPQEGFTGEDSFIYRATANFFTILPLSAATAAPEVGGGPVVVIGGVVVMDEWILPGPTPFDLAKVTITVRPINHPPEARNDEYSTPQGTLLEVPAPGVLRNDVGVPGKPLVARLAEGPVNGELTLNPNGSFVYKPKADYTGTDSFTYRAHYAPMTAAGTTDPNTPDASNLATVLIHVRPIIRPPVAHDDEYRTTQDTLLKVESPGVLKNDVGADGQRLIAHSLEGPAHGRLELNLDGSFVYKPAEGFSGHDKFTYRASYSPTPNAAGADDERPAPDSIATVTIFVARIIRPPVAHDDFYRTAVNSEIKIEAPGVLKNDEGAAGLRLAARLVEGPDVGELSLSADGSFKYVPKTDFTGRVAFKYRAVYAPTPADPATISDQPIPIEGNVATVVIFVGQLPVAHDDVYTVAQGSVLEAAPPGVLGNDVGAPGHPLKARLVEGPAHGELRLNADGSFRYEPKDDYAGPDGFTYRAVDATPLLDPTLGNSGAVNPLPSPESNIATVHIRVLRVIRPPVAHDDSYRTAVNTEIKIEAPGVLKNDDGAAGLRLAARLVEGPDVGELSLSADGSFKYVPKTDFTGRVAFKYRAVYAPSPTDPATENDRPIPVEGSIATVVIFVGPIVPLPDANDDAYSTPQGTVLEVAPPGVLENDEGAPGHTLAALLVRGPEHGELRFHADGSFRYEPRAGYAGPDHFTYHAIDATPVQEEVSDVAAPNPRPSDVATVHIRVTPTNGVPIARPDEYSTPKNASLTIPPAGVLRNDIAPAGQELAAVLIARPAHGTLTLNRDGSFSYVPAADFSGIDGFYYRAALANGSGSNDLPVVDSIAKVTIKVTHPRAIQNRVRPLDVNGDTFVSAIDALVLFNYMDRERAEGETQAFSAASAAPFYDVDGDGFISAIDPLLVFNHINTHGAEGEGAIAASPAVADQESADLLALLAYDAADDAARKRKAS